MAAPKYVARVLGKFKEVIAVVVATANSIVATDATGRIDASFLPVGVGPELTTAPAFENLSAGNFVNLFLSGGVIKVRLADATTAGKPAHGFVLANVTAPANAQVYSLSQTNTALTGLTIGSEYYLSTTPGAVLVDPGAIASGNLNQHLGIADSATELVFEARLGTCEIA